MATPRFRSKAERHADGGPTAPAARPRWPVDPELSRRVVETRSRIEHTRRQLRRHVLPERRRRREDDVAPEATDA